MNKLKYKDVASMSYFMEKYEDLENWSSFDERKEEIRKANPRLLELHDDIIRMKRDLADKIRMFDIELEDSPQEDYE